MDKNVDKSSLLTKILLNTGFYLVLVGAVLMTVDCGVSVGKFGVWSHKGAKVYYDAVNGARHLWNRGNRRYRSDYHTI